MKHVIYRRVPFRLPGAACIVIVAALLDVNAAQEGLRARQEAIARTYAGAYETVRRFDEFSQTPQGRPAGQLGDDGYYGFWFKSSALDVRTSMIAEALDDVRLRDVAFFRVYPATTSPPSPVYVVGVDPTGVVFRLRGFEASDFRELVRNEPLTTLESVSARVTLFYRLSSPLRPGPLLSNQDARKAQDALRREHDSPQSGAKENDISAARITRRGDGWKIELEIFDATSTRLERHQLQVSSDGTLIIEEQRVIRDVRAASY